MGVGLLSCRDLGFNDLNPEEITPTTKVSVEVVSSLGGFTTPSGRFEIIKGSNLVLSLNPEPGFKSDSVVVNGVSSPLNSNEYNITINNKDTTFISVVFSKIPEAETFSVETRVIGSGGTINPLGITQVVKGFNFSLTFVPSLWYKVDYVRVNGELTPLTTGNTLILFAVDKKTTIEVFFIKDPSFPWVLNGETFDLDSMYMLHPGGEYWDKYKILGVEGERQEKLVFKLDSVSTYWDEAFVIKQKYEITNTTPPMFKLLGEGNEVTILFLNGYRLVLGITNGITPDIGGQLIYKARQ